MKRKKKMGIIHLPQKKEILQRTLKLIEVNALNQVPHCYTKCYSLLESDTIESCCQHYENKYKHEPLEGWLYTNSQNQRLLYLKISDEEK